MRPFFVILILLITWSTSGCKKSTIPLSPKIDFTLSRHRGSKFTNFTVKNQSNQISKFEWYVNEKFFTSVLEPSSSELIGQMIYGRNTIKVTGIGNNGEILKKTDTFFLIDTDKIKFDSIKIVGLQITDSLSYPCLFLRSYNKNGLMASITGVAYNEPSLGYNILLREEILKSNLSFVKSNKTRNGKPGDFTSGDGFIIFNSGKYGSDVYLSILDTPAPGIWKNTQLSELKGQIIFDSDLEQIILDFGNLEIYLK